MSDVAEFERLVNKVLFSTADKGPSIREALKRKEQMRSSYT